MMKMENYEKVKTIILVTLAIVTVLAIGLGSLLRSSRVFKSSKGLGPIEEGIVEIKEDFDIISVNLSVAKFDVQYGDTASIYYKIPKNLIPEINVKGNTLEISNAAGNVNLPGDIKSLDNRDYQVTLIIPKNSEYISMDISVNCGDINLEKIKLENISVDADFGQISIADLDCTNCEINADMGDISLNNIVAKNLVVDVDCGNIVVDGIECDVVNADNSMGNIEIKEAKAETGEFDVDMGSLTINGDFDEITAGCSMGSIDVTTDKPESQVKLDLDVDMGAVTVNGKEWKN